MSMQDLSRKHNKQGWLIFGMMAFMGVMYLVTGSDGVKVMLPLGMMCFGILLQFLSTRWDINQELKKEGKV